MTIHTRADADAESVMLILREAERGGEGGVGAITGL